MAVVRLKGLNRKTVKLAGGRTVTYWYAWKGGPRLDGAPGTVEFMASYNAAVADRRTSGRRDTLAGLVTLYKSKPEFLQLADSTRAEWARWLDRIIEHPIGELSLRLLGDRRVRADLMDWRDEYADRPRAADYGMQVLSRVLSFAVERGMLAVNLAAGVTQLYESDRADKIWAAGQISAYRTAAPSPEVGFIVPLAALTGLRRSDLARLALSHVGDVAIVLPAGKSRRKGGDADSGKTLIIPIIPELRELLAEIRAQQLKRLAELAATAARKRRPPPPEPLTVLTNTRGKPWTPAGLEHQVIDTKARAGVDRHLHDARGTYVTRLRRAGLKASEIADVVGWEEDRVKALLAIYVDRDNIVMDLAARIGRSAGNDSGTPSPE